MVKMAKRPFEELVELLERELEDRLRIVLRLDRAGIERLFARDDLSLRTDDELGQSFTQRVPRAGEPVDLLSIDTGGPECLVGFSDETVELLLYRHPNEAVAVSFDRDGEGGLGEFVERCLAALR